MGSCAISTELASVEIGGTRSSTEYFRIMVLLPNYIL